MDFEEFHERWKNDSDFRKSVDHIFDWNVFDMEIKYKANGFRLTSHTSTAFLERIKLIYGVKASEQFESGIYKLVDEFKLEEFCDKVVGIYFKAIGKDTDYVKIDMNALNEELGNEDE